MTSIQLKLKVAVGVCNIRVQNHKTFQNSCAESSKVYVWNHQDNYFLINMINVACRSDANLINGHWSSRVDIWKVKIQHLVSLFTLFRNYLLSACQELSRNSNIKVAWNLEHQLIQNGEPDAWDEHNMGPAGPMKIENIGCTKSGTLLHICHGWF